MSSRVSTEAELVALLAADAEQLVERDDVDEGDLAEDRVQVARALMPISSATSASVGVRCSSASSVGVGPLDLAGLVADRARDPVDRAQLVDDRAADAADRVGLELDRPLEVELLDRVDQPEDAVGDQVGLLDVRRQADADPAGDVLDQRRVVQDQPLAQRAASPVSLKSLPQLAQRCLGCAVDGGRLVDAVPRRRSLVERRVGRLRPSGSGVRLVIRRLQPLDGHVRVDLRRRERSVTEQLLNASQVGSPLQQVGRGRVAQPVRAEVGAPGTCADQVA